MTNQTPQANPAITNPPKMKTILTCTDGSLYAPSVYQHAAWAAERLNARISILHMLNPHHEHPVAADYSGSIGFGAKSGLLDELVRLEEANAKIAQKRGQAILEDAEAVLRAAGAEAVESMQKHGKLSEEISTYERDADLVVIGKRGNNANFEKGHLGSNLERVIRSCAHPVLVASREFVQPQEYLLAYDGGPSSSRALRYCIEEPLLAGLKCHLICVSPSDELTSQFSEAFAQLESAGITVSKTLLQGSPVEALADYIQSHPIGLVVMGAYSHSHLRTLFVGSTTSRILISVRHPMLLFR